jgi:hypothetical protein
VVRRDHGSAADGPGPGAKRKGAKARVQRGTVRLVQRLAALVPPPHANMVLYHGVFGPSAAWRDQVVPTGREPEPSRGRLTKRCTRRRSDRARRRWPWSDLLWHAPRKDRVGLMASDARAVGASWWCAPWSSPPLWSSPATLKVLGGLDRAAARAPPAGDAQAA